MPRKKKLSTPDWIIEGYDSPDAYKKAKGMKGSEQVQDLSASKSENERKKKKSGKTFKIKECPECGSDDVGVVIGGEEAWECRKCKWNGTNIVEKELTEDELMEHMDKKGEEVA